jgi:hypothetical protein
VIANPFRRDRRVPALGEFLTAQAHRLARIEEEMARAASARARRRLFIFLRYSAAFIAGGAAVLLMQAWGFLL